MKTYLKQSSKRISTISHFIKWNEQYFVN